MLDVGPISTAGPVAALRAETRFRAAPLKRWNVLLMSALALVTSITAPVILSARPAAADQVSSLQAEAKQLSEQILRDQLEIGGLQQQYVQATQRLQDVEAAAARAERALQDDRRKISEDRSRLRRAAIGQYIDSGSTAANSASQVFSPNLRTAQARSEYEGLAADDVTVAVDALHADQASLARQAATLRKEQHQAQATQQEASSLLQQSQQTQNQLQAEQSHVKGQLATAIAQQQAARETAARAAIARAQQEAAAQAAAARSVQVQQAPSPTTTTPNAGSTTAAPATTPAPTAAPPPTTTTTTMPAQPLLQAPASPPPSAPSVGTAPALNSFLQCVLQAESGGNYSVVSPNGQYMGAFQFSQSTWNQAAQLAGMPYLVGVAPNTASVAQQNALAVALYNADGQSPWYDPCTGH